MKTLLTALGLVLAVLTTTAAAQTETAAARPGEVTVSILDVGQGDAILIRSPEGKTALIDAGPSHHVVTLLKQRGITTLDLVILSHHHADHYGGMADVVKAFRPRFFLASNSAHTSPHYLKLLELVRDQRISALQPQATPRRLELGSVVLTVLPQAPEDPGEENNNSVGVRLQYGHFSVLFPGDAEQTERLWWEKNAPTLCADCSILKLAHHGSRNGTDAPWLDLVRPQLGVASVGRSNEFGHPHPETVALLAEHRIPLLRTDLDGTVVIESDGRTWRVFHEPPASASAAVRSGHRTATRTPRHEVEATPRPSRVNINTATADQLMTIPGIGPVLSRRIIAGRPYLTLDQLRRVEGLGAKRLAEIRPYIATR
jgi:beta-lactamase superfamily II metal-dependent hydrolase